MGQKLQGTIGGAVAGSRFGGLPGAIVGGILGYAQGSNAESEEQKNQLLSTMDDDEANADLSMDEKDKRNLATSINRGYGGY